MKKILIRLGAVLSILFLGAYIYMSWMFSGLMLRPDAGKRAEKIAILQDIKENGAKPGSTLAGISMPYKEFELETEDGITLKGWHFSESDTPICAVVMAHGWSSSRLGSMRYAHVFDSCGCDMVVYDHRAHGESTGDFVGGGDLEKDDLIASLIGYKKKRTCRISKSVGLESHGAVLRFWKLAVLDVKWLSFGLMHLFKIGTPLFLNVLFVIMAVG